MLFIVICEPPQKEELLSNRKDLDTVQSDRAINIAWINNLAQLENYKEAAVVLDLLFEKTHMDRLQQFEGALVIINSVDATLSQTHRSFVRINGWPTFLSSSLIEAAFLEEDNKQKTEEFFSLFNKQIEWLPDTAGFVTPRVISMIINEAFIALEEGVSTKEEINTAMKLGTNYPYGPFEWAERIGVERVNGLLKVLGQQPVS